MTDDPFRAAPPRGSVWWCDLGTATGSAPAEVRPVVVVSADPFNNSAIRTVMVAPLTSNLDRAAAPGNVELDRGESGLPKASVVNVSQVVTVDKTQLVDRLGRLEPHRIDQVDDGLRLALGL
ncbi:MAG: type II toxin-antitoxin system PemK/MazF family toxin [Acidimicrobiales bacterium]